MIYTYLFISAWAIYCAWDDQQQIQRGQRILHALQWAARTSLVVAVLALFTDNSHFYSLPQIMFLAIGSGALFSMVFRYCLNRMRGLDWRYVSPSSRYDWQFIRHTLNRTNKGKSYRERVLEYHQSNYFSGDYPKYVMRIHWAGLLAYAVEFMVFVACTYLVIVAEPKA